METRAHYLLIGGFVLALVFAMFGFVIWLARLDVDQEYTRYDIYFEGAVSGLTKGSTVRLNGVPVGQVTRITIPPEDPSRVKVEVKIRSDVPITEGAVARLEVLGFTGVSFVQIRGSQGTRRLEPPRPGVRPVIPSERSPIQQVFEEAPDLVNEAILAINALRQLLNERNRARVAAILANLEATSAALAAGREDLAAVPGDARRTLDALADAARRIAAAAEAIERVVREEGGPTVAEARDAFAALGAFSRSLNDLVERNKPAVDRFTGETLPEVGRLVSDLRRASRSLERLLQAIEDHPSEFLFGTSRPEYRPPAGGRDGEHRERR